MFREVCFKVF